MSGRGNGAAMETTERFPQRLGNLAGEREIPTFPPPIIAGQRNQQKKGDWTATTDSGTLSARSDEGTPGGKVLKSRGPYLLQTDNNSANQIVASVQAPLHGTGCAFDPLTGIATVSGSSESR